MWDTHMSCPQCVDECLLPIESIKTTSMEMLVQEYLEK